jgi:hypothetical protein
VHVLRLPQCGAALHWPVPTEQPHAPFTQCGPGLHDVVQSLHTPPVLPHWAFDVPRTQVPVVLPDGMEQHPLLHGDEALQVVVQACVVVLHSSPARQSAELLHPQVPFDRQPVPVTLPVQLMQTPAVPHAAPPVPAEQVPVVLPEGIEQHPP